MGLHSSSCLLLFLIAAALVRPALPLQASSSPLCSVVVIALLRLGVMGKAVVPMRGIRADFKARLACYKHDWIGGFDSGYRCVRGRERERDRLCALFSSPSVLANKNKIQHCSSQPWIPQALGFFFRCCFFCCCKVKKIQCLTQLGVGNSGS